MSFSTGQRCEKIKQILLTHQLVHDSQLCGSLLNFESLDEDLQNEISRFGCDLPIIRSQNNTLHIYFSCCDKQEIIKIEATMDDFGHLQIVENDIYESIGTEKVA